MTLLDWFRNLISGPPHVHDTIDDPGEVAADLGEEYGAPAPHEHIPSSSHLAPAEAAEVAEDDFESMEAPPDTDP